LYCDGAKSGRLILDKVEFSEFQPQISIAWSKPLLPGKDIQLSSWLDRLTAEDLPPDYFQASTYRDHGALMIKIYRQGDQRYYGRWVNDPGTPLPLTPLASLHTLYKLQFSICKPKTNPYTKDYLPNFGLSIFSNDGSILEELSLNSSPNKKKNIDTNPHLPGREQTKTYCIYFVLPPDSVDKINYGLRFNVFSDANDKGEVGLKKVEIQKLGRLEN
jgi:hypothetical protein